MTTQFVWNPSHSSPMLTGTVTMPTKLIEICEEGGEQERGGDEKTEEGGAEEWHARHDHDG
eukprot:3266091-Rhodomonas_salina.1